MDDQYYRKPKPKQSIILWLKKIIGNRRLFVTLLIAIPMVSFVMFSNKGVLKRMSLESDKQAMQDKVQQALREQSQLQRESKALDNDNRAIEKVAREKYGMIREGETVYKVKKEK